MMTDVRGATHRMNERHVTPKWDAGGKPASNFRPVT